MAWHNNEPSHGDSSPIEGASGPKVLLFRSIHLSRSPNSPRFYVTIFQNLLVFPS